MYLAKKKTKLGRNDLCPCGSGRKYKKCCMRKAPLFTGGMPASSDLKKLYLKKYKIRLKDEKDIEGIRQAGRLVMDTLDMVESEIRPGMTTDDINTLVHEYTIKNNAQPAPLNYRGFPKSACVSINEVICHGIPGKQVIQSGDIVNVDVTSVLGGYFADANKTYFAGEPGPDAQKIVNITLECLMRSIAVVKPGNTTGDIGAAIQEYAEANGASVVREFVGHGVGFEFHEAPQVAHYGIKGEGIVLVPGMVFTIEPMINSGSEELIILKDKWTVITKDRSLSAQFEQTVLVTETGVESLTPF